ncbi:MAG TPA: YCF48-related protein [Candidatus Kryptonia bacterium]
MKSKIRLSILSLVFVLLVPSILAAQWVLSNSNYCDAFAVSGTNLFAGAVNGGNTGGILLSTNNGTSWTAVNTGLSVYGLDVQALAVSGTNLFAGTYGGGVYLSTNNGTNWTPVDSGLGQYESIFALASSGTNLFAGTYDNGVYLSTNNGANWTQVVSGIPVAGYGFFDEALAVSGTNLFVGTYGGGVFLSTDNGTSWTAASTGLTDWSLNVLALAVSGTNLFAGTAGGVFLSTNNGTTWTAASTGLTNMSLTVNALTILGTNLFAGTDGGVFLSTDNGTSWTEVSTGLTGSSLYVYAFVVSGTNLFAGTQYGIWRRPLSEMTGSPNSSPGWTVQTSGITTGLYAVKAVSNSVAWAAGDSGKVLVTTDGGSSWKSVGGGNLSTNNLFEIEALDASNALVFFNEVSPGWGAYICRTTDAGGTWSTVYGGLTNIIFGMKMCDASNGFALGEPDVAGGKWIILKTTNGGAIWNNVANGPAEGSQLGSAMATVGTSNIWFGACDATTGSIYRSTDGGTSWSSKAISTSQPMSLAFSDEQNGFASCYDSSVVRTTDGGATWTSVTIPGSGGTMIYACGNDVFASTGPNIYRSTDRGATWTISFTGSIGEFYTCSFISSGSTLAGWAVSTTGKIVRFAGTATDIRDNNASRPSSFGLSQNFPNPFNPTTTINYQLPKRSRITLKVYDALGREVATLVDGQKNAGEYKVTFDGSRYASGVYFYRIQAGTFTAVKKIMLMK